MTNRQELKEKIIKELLPKLSIDPCGGYVNAEELSKKSYDSVEDYRLRTHSANHGGEPKLIEIDPENILTEEDNKEISWAIVEDIRQHANEWSIEQENELTAIRHVSGKKHYKEGFAPYEWGEWIEIERALTKFQKSKELKGQLLNSLSGWGIDLHGNIFTPVNENSIDWEWDSKGVGKIVADKEQFTEMDYQEIKQKVIEDVKVLPSLKKWKFDKAVCWWDKKEATKMSEYLVLKSLEDPRRIYYKDAFSLQEWAEIEKILSQSQQQQTQQVESLMQQTANWLPFRSDDSSGSKH